MSARSKGAGGETKTRAVAYIRVSTSKQVDQGVSLEAQEAKLHAYAALYGLELVLDPETGRDVIVDAGESAKSLERPGLRRALRMLRTGQADALLVVKLDRLTRSVRDLGALIEDYFSGKAALLSVGEQIDTRTAGGRLVLNVLGAVSQWEREAIGERTSAALRHMLSTGAYTGGDEPFGYRVEGARLVPREDEQAIIDEARAMHATGTSLRGVAAQLEAMGYRSRAGRPFLAAQVARMVGSSIGASA
jgi:DNA invertase Pin-like site-specific DNA recombinase